MPLVDAMKMTERPAAFPLGKVLAEPIRDVGPGECLVSTETQRRPQRPADVGLPRHLDAFR